VKLRGPGLIFSGFSLIFIDVGSYMAWSQDHAMRAHVPVTANVLSRDIESNSDSDGTTYRPVVKYRYTVNGRSYESDQVTVLKEASGHSWATGVLARIPSGDTVRAYYDPADPSSAFLLRETSFFPYIFILFPMVFMCIGLASMVSDKPPDIQGLRPLVVMAIAWNGVGLLVASHYFGVGGALDLTAKVALALYGLIGGLMLYSAVYQWFESRNYRSRDFAPI
jgi:hypothetical protein